MCNCLIEKAKKLESTCHFALKKGRYFVLLTGRLNIWEEDKFDKDGKKEYGVTVGSSSIFAIEYCPWCGEKLETKPEQDNTNNRVFFDVS